MELNGLYEGWKFTFRKNPPIGILQLITSGQIGDVVQGLGELVIDWNFVDENGKDLGEPDAFGIAKLPVDLLTQMAEEISKNIGQVDPKSKTPS